MNNYDYPAGADTSDAPWNGEKYPLKEIDVTVSVTMSKTFRISVDDYKVEACEDEDGECPSYDFSDCNLKEAVEDQVVLPQNLAEYTEKIFDHDLNLKAAGMPMYLKDAINDCMDWSLDDYEVVMD